MSKNIAHRGYSGNYPENTMLAFRKAIEVGCDGIETDVQMTKDGEMILCHDEKIDRTTDGTGYIIDYTYDELKKFNAGNLFKDKYGFVEIPKLSDLFDLVKNKDLLINLELKNSEVVYKNLEENVIKMIYKYNMQNNVIISSFNHYSIIKCKSLDPGLKYGILYDCWIHSPGDYVKALGMDACHPSYYSLNEETIENIKKNGLKINTYTVNDESDMRRLIHYNIDGLITNYPEKLGNILKEEKQKI